MIHRLGAVSGLIAVVLLVWSNGVFPELQSSPQDADAVVIAEVTEVGAGSDGGMFLAMLAVPFLVAFGAFVADRFRRHAAEGWIGSTFLAGVVLLGVSFMILGGVAQMSSTLGGIPGAESIARFVVVFGWNGSNLFVPAILAIGGTAAIGAFSSDALPSWVGFGAVVVTLSALMPWIGILVLMLWIGITSLVLTVERSTELVTT